ncbi:MAG: ATP cone domain-containing protein [Candidatus Bipolaricaulota bacterium]|nr:ATP cone domain-containing protein [Candidatus Bipolaricaulota bacterium]
MAVVNKIGKIRKRNHALVAFDQDRIVRVILRASTSVGGFEQDYLPGINDRIFAAGETDEGIAQFLSDLVVVCLNADERHHVSNFPPTVEEIQNVVLHVLSSNGFTKVADTYTCFRWGHHWVREGAITEEQFVRNGYPPEQMEPWVAWNREHDCDTVEGLNDIVSGGRLARLVSDSLERYEASLDEAAKKVVARIEKGDALKMIWVSGPSSSGKTTTTVKLTQRLEKAGLRFLMLNLDDYFWSLIEHPTDWIDDRNFETPEALDIQLMNEHLRALLEGKAIEKPVYSFKEGRRTALKPVRRERDQILLLDCLHGFYPPITAGIDPKVIFRVYIEAMNPLYEPNPMMPLYHGDRSDRRLTRFEDVRLLRRMLRDVNHRNHPPLATLLHWHYVRAGELFSIIPLKGMADCALNGGMPFDLPALKPFFVGDDGIWPTVGDLKAYPSFLDAQIRHRRVTHLLDSVQGLTLAQARDLSLIPGDAVVREFIGGSTISIPHNE